VSICATIVQVYYVSFLGNNY